jgi:predicted signal transduction protein with EAL and GGDEF domain/FixJ family two-component response regulator
MSAPTIQQQSLQFQGYPRRCILIIDDDPAFTLLASETLQQAGFDARIASNARDAVSAFEQHRPDLVLLDVELPGSNGFELCATLRVMSPGIDVPIVMVTGHDDTASIAQAYHVGATDFIHKPVLWPTLPHRIGFILRARDNMRALQASEQKNRALLQALPDTIFIVGRDGLLVEHITGDDRGNGVSLVGKPLEQVLPVGVARAARQAVSGDGRCELSAYEFAVGRGKEQRSFEARLRPQPDGTLLIVTRDTTERQKAKARIEYLAYYDILTGLANRQQFVRQAGGAIQAAKQSGHMMALLYLDLDRFKRINDNLGHSVGDALLKNVARRLQQSVGPSDLGAMAAATTPAAMTPAAMTPAGASPSDTARQAAARVARLGGDEFVVLLTGLSDEAQTAAVANRIRQSLAEPLDCGGHRLVVTPSIGIALYPQDGTDIEDLLVKADMAMYQAKDQGRNGFAFYGHSMAVRSLGRLELENDLRSAFQTGDFEIFYQPKVELAGGTIIGVEALLRWHHATRGWISPEVFIPVAEETGLIAELGDWVIRQACKQLNNWVNDGLGHLTIAVNVSVQQFARADFVESVLRTLWQYGVKPEQLELEITETLLMRNVDDTTACMKRFRAAGVMLSIDDFGTGYSSLGYLRQFPVDALKIDRSFVKDLHTSDDDAAICAAIIAMARELKLKVIAEGVANDEQLEFLRRHGCDQVQGYLISEPIPVADLTRLLQNAKRLQGAPLLKGAGSQTQATEVATVPLSLDAAR